MRRYIAVKPYVYERLLKIKEELGLSTMNDVLDTLLKLFEGCSLAQKIWIMSSIIDEVKQLLADILQVESTMETLAVDSKKEAKAT
jgi:predicted CopG family antitoxin